MTASDLEALLSSPASKRRRRTADDGSGNFKFACEYKILPEGEEKEGKAVNLEDKVVVTAQE